MPWSMRSTRSRPSGRSRRNSRAPRSSPVSAAGLSLPLHPVRVDRPHLPAYAELLRIHDRGGQPAWHLGRGLDGLRPDLPLSPGRHIRAGFRVRGAAARCTCPRTLALWFVAQHLGAPKPRGLRSTGAGRALAGADQRIWDSSPAGRAGWSFRSAGWALISAKRRASSSPNQSIPSWAVSR